MKKRAVIALGGNALIKKGQQGTIYEQFANTRESAKVIVKMIKNNWDVLITHGNGPQVGSIFLQNEANKNVTPAMPLGICVAESEGYIGYMIQQCLANALQKQHINKPVVAMITQVIVSPKDPDLKNPTKPIGPAYTAQRAVKMLKEGYQMVHTPKGWRMVAPSPDPLTIVEAPIIKKMMESGFIVIAAGGGGMPVIQRKGWGFDGLEAVVDKDLAAERLAEIVNADVLLILTEEKYVYLNYGSSKQKPVRHLTLKEAKTYYAQGQFPPGSMEPKILAAVRFLEWGGKKVIISHMNQGWDALQEKTGTLITKK